LHEHREVPGLRPSHPAQFYDALLDGRHNTAADRAAVAAFTRQVPTVAAGARAYRAFMHRTTRYVAHRGVTQFLDGGSGIPTSPNLHEVAQSIRPDARVVYVDKDRTAIDVAATLLDTCTPAGTLSYIQADLRSGAALLELSGLDQSKPIALSLNAVIHFLSDDEAYDVVRSLTAPLVPGSYVAMTHLTFDYDREAVEEMASLYSSSTAPLLPRTGEEIARFFTGLEIIDPGIIGISEWRPDPATDPESPPAELIHTYGVLARVPG
jgi:S-adenosyl methyltransferase